MTKENKTIRYRISEDHMDTIMIKKSKFLCYLHRCFSEDDAKAFLLSLKKEHPNANHVCYAYIIDENLKRSNDDGEPSGTAGKPMLTCLTARHLEKIVVATVRYFGGIKLGSNGLIHAYKESVEHALASSSLVKVVNMKKFMFTFPYSLNRQIDFICQQQNIIILNKTYHQEITYELLSEDDIHDLFNEVTSGLSLPLFKEEIRYEQEISS